MTDLGAVLEQLKQQRQEAESRLRTLDEAVAALSKIVEENLLLRGARQRKYRLSEAARERISNAQKERWAKLREKPTKPTKQTK